MKKDFEKEVYYFLDLVFNNIQVAKTSKNKTKAVFTNLKLKPNGEEVIVYNKEKNYSYVLYTKQIQDFDFKIEFTKHIALYYIYKLTKYLNHKITFKEFADVRDKAPPVVKNILEQKNNISEQLKLLRRHRNIPEVQRYIENLYHQGYTSAYVKYLINRYYFNKKGLTRPKKTVLKRCSKYCYDKKRTMFM